MKVIDPHQPVATAGRTRTLTGRLLALRPSWPDLIDAGFLTSLLLLALLGFASTFDSPRYLIVGAIGTLLGTFAAHVANVMRLHWLMVITMAVAAFFLLGGAVALQQDAIAGVLPSITTLIGLSNLTLNGWKELLTTLPPVSGDGPYLALPYLLAVLAGSIGFAAARRSRRVWVPLVTPTVLFAMVILLGTLRPPAPVAQGVGFAALAFGWLAVRWHRRRRLAGTGSANLTRVVVGATVMTLAAGGALLLGPQLPGTQSAGRVVLRSYVQPPIDLEAYPSPLVGFRKYSSKQLKRYFKEELLRVEGVAPGNLVRMAVLDEYSGYAWSATGGGAGGPTTGFQRLGSEIPVSVNGDRVQVGIEILRAYAGNPDLRHWLPSAGQAVANRFEGRNARSHSEAFRFNLTTFQGLVPDNLVAGDIIRQTVVPLPDLGEAPLEPGGAPVVGYEGFGFLTPVSGKLAPGTDSAWQQLLQVMETLRSTGYYSDGTNPGEERYRAGHGQNRLTAFLGEDQIVGSDEHYAATLGLIANELGFPARVVFGAEVPAGGVVTGADVHAWVEVMGTGGSWRTIRPDTFIPPRDKRPDEIPPEKFRDAAAVVVPPPNPVRPPGSFEAMFESDVRILVSGNELLDRILQVLVGILRWVGPPLLVILAVAAAILGIKAVRRRARRARGAPTTRIAGGWLELLDQARDLGHAVPAEGTRREQVLAVGRSDLVGLATTADRAVFGKGEPGAKLVDDYWVDVMATRRAMLHPLKGGRRWLARLSLRSLLPRRADAAVAAQQQWWESIPRPWAKVGRR